LSKITIVGQQLDTLTLLHQSRLETNAITAMRTHGKAVERHLRKVSEAMLVVMYPENFVLGHSVVRSQSRSQHRA
jgi:hypothetical protein